MAGWVEGLLAGAGVLLASWAVLVVLAARLPDGTLKELAGFLPNCVHTARALRRHPDVPRRAKFAVGFAALWCLSPIDLIPEFLPVIGPLDDVVVVALALRYAARQVPRPSWTKRGPGTPPRSTACSGRAGPRRGRAVIGSPPCRPVRPAVPGGRAPDPAPGRAAWPGRRSTPRSSWALAATTMVEALMRMAPTAGDRVMPAQARTPAASGMATMLYPAAHARFWTILRYDARDSRITPIDAAGVAAGQHHAGRLDGDVGAGADGDAHVGPGQCGGIVDPVTHHGDRAAPAPGGRRPPGPCPRAAPRRTPRRCRGRAATASATCRASPVIITTSTPMPPQVGDGLPGLGPHLVLERQGADHLALPAHQVRHGRAPRRPPVGGGSEARRAPRAPARRSRAGPPTA